MHDIPVFVFELVLGGFITVVLVLTESWRRRHLKPSEQGTTLLLSHVFFGVSEVINAKSGTTPAGLYYQYLVGLASFASPGQSEGVYTVELPFCSGVHLVGIPKQGEDFVVQAKGSVMEPVELEGDYPDYFLLYADRGEQMQTRFVLDPKAMVFTIDFCRRFAWEIIDDSLYFTSHEAIIPFDIIDQFVTEIRPAVEIESQRTANPQMTMPYANFEGRKLLCPVCGAQLAMGENEWLSCPSGHGNLLTADQLLALRSTEDSEAENTQIEQAIAQYKGEAVAHESLVCPYCHGDMAPVQFGTTDVMINVCSKCTFRWLDAGEAGRLFLYG